MCVRVCVCVYERERERERERKKEKEEEEEEEGPLQCCRGLERKLCPSPLLVSVT